MRGIDLPAPLRRVPFTLLLAFTILVTAVATGTLVGRLSPDELAGCGFGADDLAHGRWLRLLVATAQILDPSMALSMIATVMAMVGACEYRLGTARTVVVFAISEVAGAVSMILMVKVFAALGSDWGRALATGREVGASAGAIGTAAAWLVFQPPRTRRIGVAACAAFLTLAFGGDVHPWDVEHAVAFPLGLALGAFLRAREGRRSAEPAAPGGDFLPGPGARRVAVAWVAATVGLVAVLSPFAMATHLGLARVAGWLHVGDVDRVRYAFLASGVALLAAAPALRHGRHDAWATALAATLVVAVGFWQPGAPGVEHILAALLLAALIRWRAEFRVARPARSLRSALRTGAMLPAALVVYLGFGFLALRHEFIPPFDAAGVARVTVSRLRLDPVPTPNWNAPPARWFLDSIPVVTYVALLAGLAGPGWAAIRRRLTSTTRPGGGRGGQSD